jgi:hypothetical protein
MKKDLSSDLKEDKKQCTMQQSDTKNHLPCTRSEQKQGTLSTSAKDYGLQT